MRKGDATDEDEEEGSDASQVLNDSGSSGYENDLQN